MDKNKESTIEIFSGTLWEAEMVKSLLANAEIDSFLLNTTVNSYILDPIQAEGVKVLILESDFKEAKEIVEAYCRNQR